MSRLVARFVAGERWEVEHLPSGVRLLTDRPSDLGGADRSFSATDLVAAALAVCVAASLEPVAARHGLDPARVTVTVEKRMASPPRRIGALDVTVALRPDAGASLSPDLARRLERAARSCPVHASLHPDVAVSVALHVVQ